MLTIILLIIQKLKIILVVPSRPILSKGFGKENDILKGYGGVK